MEILQNLTTQIDLQAVRKFLHLDRHRNAQLVQGLIDKAKTLIEPKAAFKLCYIDEKLQDAVFDDTHQIRIRNIFSDRGFFC